MPRFVRNAQRQCRRRRRLHHRRQPSTPNPASTSAWLNVPPAPSQQPPQYPPQAQPYHGYQPPRQTDGKATASLILGIASFSCAFQFSPEFQPSFWDTFRRSKIKRSMGRLKGDGMALAGLIMGYISVLPSSYPDHCGHCHSESVAGQNFSQRISGRKHCAHDQYLPGDLFHDVSRAGVCARSGYAGRQLRRSGGTAEHACLLDSQLGQANCTSGVWCQKGHYKYTISSNCAPARFGEQQQGTENACAEYVIVATPVKFKYRAAQLLFRVGCGHSISFRIPAGCASNSRRMPRVGATLIHDEAAARMA